MNTDNTEQWIKIKAGSGYVSTLYSSKKLMTGTNEVTSNHQTKLLIN